MTHVRTIILTVLPSRSVADILILSLGPFKGNTLSGRSVSCMQKRNRSKYMVKVISHWFKQ